MGGSSSSRTAGASRRTTRTSRASRPCPGNGSSEASASARLGRRAARSAHTSTSRSACEARPWTRFRLSPNTQIYNAPCRFGASSTGHVRTTVPTPARCSSPSAMEAPSASLVTLIIRSRLGSCAARSQYELRQRPPSTGRFACPDGDHPPRGRGGPRHRGWGARSRLQRPGLLHRECHSQRCHPSGGCGLPDGLTEPRLARPDQLSTRQPLSDSPVFAPPRLSTTIASRSSSRAVEQPEDTRGTTPIPR